MEVRRSEDIQSLLAERGRGLDGDSEGHSEKIGIARFWELQETREWLNSFRVLNGSKREISPIFEILLRKYLGWVVRELAAGEYFGEKVFLSDNALRSTSIVCKSDAVCQIADFSNLIGDVQRNSIRNYQSKVNALKRCFPSILQYTDEQIYQFQYNMKVRAVSRRRKEPSKTPY